jgi:hypothetical protein
MSSTICSAALGILLWALSPISTFSLSFYSPESGDYVYDESLQISWTTDSSELSSCKKVNLDPKAEH